MKKLLSIVVLLTLMIPATSFAITSGQVGGSCVGCLFNASPIVLTNAALRFSYPLGGPYFIDSSTVDLSAYGTGNYRIVVSDGSKTLAASVVGVGTGETKSELTPNNTAVSDSRVEANATTGWDAIGSPETFESTASGTPNVGSYHFHVVSSGGYRGFKKDIAGAVLGQLVYLSADIKVISGRARMQTNNPEILVTPTSSTYSTYVRYGTIAYVPSVIYFRSDNVAAEFYGDNIKHGVVTTPSSLGITLGTPVVEAGFNPNSTTYTVYIWKLK